MNKKREINLSALMYILTYCLIIFIPEIITLGLSGELNDIYNLLNNAWIAAMLSIAVANLQITES
jgi:hypothetical protein